MNRFCLIIISSLLVLSTAPLYSQTDSFNNLNAVLLEMDKSGKRLSSGTLLWTDSPSSKAIYEKLESHINSLDMMVRNDRDMISYYRSREGYLETMLSALQRIRNLVLQRSGSLYGPDEREIIDAEIYIHYGGILKDISQAQFNGIRLFSSWTDDSLQGRFRESEFYSIEGIDRILESLLRERAGMGALINTLNIRARNSAAESENATAFQSLTDTEYSSDISSLKKGEILFFSNLFLLDFDE